MALYVTLREGSSAADTEPVLATGDQRIIQAVLNALALIAREANTPSSAPRQNRRAHLYQLPQRGRIHEDND